VESTWGIATSPHHRIVAVSANNHQITLFDLEKEKFAEPIAILKGNEHNVPSLGAFL